MYTKFIPISKQIVDEHKAQYKGVYVMFGGGGTTTTSSNTAPWSGQQPFLTQQYQSAQNLYNNPSDYPQVYPGSQNGSQTAPLNAAQNTAISGLENTGMNSSLINSDTNAQNYILNGGMLSQGNPYQQAELGALNAQITPQLESQFTQGNAMNNPAAAYAVSQGIGAADAGILGQNYNNAQNQLTQTSLYAPNTYTNQLQGMNTALQAGNQQQTQAQNVLNGQINAWNYNQNLPYNMLDQYASLIAGNPGSSVTQQQPYYNNTAQNLVGMGSQLGGLGLLGYMALSDRRLKKNIKRIGETMRGTILYSFEYIWGGKHIGVMADEVPHAIAGNVFGFNFVDYSRI